MKIKYLFIFLLCTFFSTKIINAQHIDYDNLSFIDINKKITKKPISSIIEDDSGFIWIATQGDGIFRFDGLNYENFTYHFEYQNSLESNIVYCLYIDSKGQLWAGTNRGISLYNKDLNRFERINFKEIGGVEDSVDVISLVEDNNSNLIIGTHYNGAFKMPLFATKVSKIKTDAKDIKELIFRRLTKSVDGTIYAGTTEGLFVLDTRSEIFKDKFPNEFDEYITGMDIDQENNLWFGTINGGIYKLDKNRNKIISKIESSNRRIFSLLFIDNQLLVGTELDGLWSYNRDTQILHKYTADRLIENSLGSLSIWQIYGDSYNRLWIGSFDQGIQVIDRFNSKFNTIKHTPGNPLSLQGSSVAGIQQSVDGKVWIGVPGGIDIYNPKTKKIEHVNSKHSSKIKGLTSTAILSVFLDSHENLWVGTWDKGLYYLEKGSKKFINYNTNTANNTIKSNAIFGFSEDSKGNIYLASFLKGIHYYDSQRKRIFYCDSPPFVENGIVNVDTRVVFVDTEDNIWVGTKTDLFKLTLKPDNSFVINRMTKLMKKNGKSLNVNPILSIYQSEDNTLWIGTNGNGLFSYDLNLKTFKDYTNFDGFSQTVINAITESENHNIWVNGKSGLSKLDFTSNSTDNYTIDDGLLSNYSHDNTLLTTNDGTIYVGSFEGVNYFKPQQLVKNYIPPKVYISNLKLFNEDVIPLAKDSPLKKEISQTAAIEFNYNQSVFTINYASINFTRPEKTTYAYRLQGFDQNWNYVGNTTSATYTNLNSGDYEFQVKAANNDGVWSIMPTTLAIKIIPAWWKTIWAQIFYLMLGLSAIWLFIDYRIETVKQRTETIYQNKLLKQINLEEGRRIAKESIAKELHDSLLGTIFGIRLGLDNSSQKDYEQQAKDRKKYVNKLSDLEQEVRSISHGLSPNLSFSTHAFTAVIEQLLAEQCTSNNIEYSLKSDAKIKWSTIHDDIKFNLYRIIQESIFNILKHSKASIVSITFEKINNALELNILDNGVGFKKGYLNKGIGLKNIKSRAESIGGQAHFENENGNGASIFIKIPLNLDKRD
ncbi:two-component regulator propeller domain-containing protein [Aurantibacter sp.]|uniref:ligand-binding sensor domain-containing protein n=1 Tax=Aurantibacter sp. TaxID=2807103 RepID=UPI00326561AB